MMTAIRTLIFEHMLTVSPEIGSRYTAVEVLKEMNEECERMLEGEPLRHLL